MTTTLTDFLIKSGLVFTLITPVNIIRSIILIKENFSIFKVFTTK